MSAPFKWHPPLVEACVRILMSVFRDNYLADRSLEFELKKNKQWGSRDRKFIAETAYGIVRWKRKLLWTIEIDEDEEFNDSIAGQLVVAYAICKMGQTELPNWMVIEPKAVERWLSRWNGPMPSSAVAHSLPDWLEARCQLELGGEWPNIVKSLNEPASVFLRANRLKCDKAHLKARLEKEEILTEELPELPDGLRLIERKNVFATDCFRDGWFEVQDGGSQLIAPLLDVKPGARVIDACAGAGGKALHLAAQMKNKGKIIALDVHERKLSELRKRAARAGVDIIESRMIEGSKSVKRLKASADRLLLDVPCSGSGVWRRNTDGRWRLTEADIEQIQKTQIEILNQYTPMVKVGGLVVYATCSIWPSENEKQVATFLDSAEGRFVLKHSMHISPADGRFDGFYAAVLERMS